MLQRNVFCYYDIVMTAKTLQRNIYY